MLEELGAALYTGPYLASAVLAATALLASADEGARKDLLPGIAAGQTIAALAFTEDGGSWDPASIRLAAAPEGDGWVLDGHKAFVLDGAAASLFLTVAVTGDGLSLFAVGAGAAGLAVTAVPTLDETRGLARLEFTSVAARLIGAPGDAAAILDRVLDVAAIALAAEQLGGAQRVLDMAVSYAKAREQFGRPIGSFQTIKHRCADLLAEVESLRSAVAYAAAAVAAGSAEVPVLASLIKAYASEVYFHAAAENIQIHGGIGFTWEHDAHLYFKRAKASELFLGDGSLPPGAARPADRHLTTPPTPTQTKRPRSSQGDLWAGRLGRLGDGEGVAVGVAEGEHRGHAGPAQDLVGVDTGGQERGVRSFGVVSGEPDADGSARDLRRRGLQGDDGVVRARRELDPPATARGRVVAQDGEAESAGVKTQGGVLVVDRDTDGPDTGDVGRGSSHRELLRGVSKAVHRGGQGHPVTLFPRT